MKRLTLILVLSLLAVGRVVFVAYSHVQSPSLNDRLLSAAQKGKGDVAAIAALLKQGAEVDARNETGTPALIFAADRANVALVKLLLDHGADPNGKELWYGKTALWIVSHPSGRELHGSQDWADRNSRKDREEVIRLLLDKGATGGEALQNLINNEYIEGAKVVISRGNRFNRAWLNSALGTARRTQQTELVDLLIKAGAKDPGPEDSARAPERLRLWAGRYRSASGQDITLRFGDDEVLLERAGREPITMYPPGGPPTDFDTLRSFEPEDRARPIKVVVAVKPGPMPPTELTLAADGRSDVFTRIGDVAAPAPGAPATRRARTGDRREAERLRGAQGSPRSTNAWTPPTSDQWPSFRGAYGAGTAGGGRLPTEWSVQKGTNIRWKTPIPGLAHSSPIVWGERVFVTTAVAGGEIAFNRRTDAFHSANNTSTKDGSHTWRVYALDKRTGRVVWERVAHRGVPRTPRHVIESQANSTPVTDGTHLVAFFGSEGLYCYDFEGKLLWKKDLGALTSGPYWDPTYEWNTATSPVIYKNLVILQLDLLGRNSFIAAFDLRSGKEIWRTARDEEPSWTTPFVYEGAPRNELITAAGLFARAYDPDTGKELWRLGKHSFFSTPTPIAGKGLIFIASGGGVTIQPIYAIRPGGSGDITLKDGEEANEFVVWSKRRGGPYLPTPIFYDDLLYIGGGVMTAYDPETGDRVYQERLGAGQFTASPVAADGKLYVASEDGEVFVVKAGRKFERLAANDMGEFIFATPAISRGTLFIRTQNYVFAIAEATSRESASR